MRSRPPAGTAPSSRQHSNGLLTSEGDFWLRQRRIAQPAFHRQRIAALAGVMADAARDAAGHWETTASAGRPVDVDDEMMRLTRTSSCGRFWEPILVRSQTGWTRPGRF